MPRNQLDPFEHCRVVPMAASANSDLANGMRLSYHASHSIRFCEHARGWEVYISGMWVQSDAEALKVASWLATWIQQEALELAAQVKDDVAAAARRRWADESCDLRRIEAALQLARVFLVKPSESMLQKSSGSELSSARKDSATTYALLHVLRRIRDAAAAPDDLSLWDTDQVVADLRRKAEGKQ